MELNSRINPETSNIDRRQFLGWTASAALFAATRRTSGGPCSRRLSSEDVENSVP